MTIPFIPAYTLPATNRRVLLTSRPVGIPQPEHFALDEVPLEMVGKGMFRVRNLYLSVDPAQRGWVNEAQNYAAAVPLGSTMRALAVGVVIESKDAAYRVGTYVYGWFGWQDYAVVDAAAILTRWDVPQAPLSAYAGVLGLNGLTAWLAFSKIGRPVAGETVLVSTAAGAVGSVVGQLAKQAGCHAIGLTGDEAKVALCTQSFGYAAAANYKAEATKDIISRLAPNGIDIFYDNVGGSILDDGLRAMNTGGRIIQCGTASIAAWEPAPVGPRNEREVLTRSLIWGGFVIFHHAAEFPAAMENLAALVQTGQLNYNEDIGTDIAAAPRAIAQLYAGKNNGKMLIFTGD